MNEFNKASYGAINDPKVVLQHGKKQVYRQSCIHSPLMILLLGITENTLYFCYIW